MRLILDFRAASEFSKSIRKLTRPDLQTLKIMTSYSCQKRQTVISA